MNVLCLADACPVLLSSKCVFYEDAALPYTGIATNDSLQVALQKIDAAIGAGSGGGTWGSITGNILDQTDLINYIANNYVPETRELTINGVTYDLSANRTWTISAGVWGAITGTITDQTDLITYLGLNFYPLSSNPAGYLTSETDPVFTAWLAGPPNVSEFTNDAGYITSAPLSGYVPTSRNLTINGVTYDLSADRTWTIVAGVASVTGLNTDNTDPANPIVMISVDGVTITGDGTSGNPLVSVPTPISGTDKQVLFFDGNNNPAGEAGFEYDKTTNTLDVDIVVVNDDPYDPTVWNGNLQVPTKNAIRDKIETLILSTNAASSVRPVVFDGMGAVILAGTKTYVRALYAGTITGWSIVADGSSPTCELDIKKIATGTVLPSASIVASDPPDLTTGNAVDSTSLVGWTTAIAAGDILEISVTTALVMTRMEFALRVT